MIAISNEDYKKAVSLLTRFSNSYATTTKGKELRRQAKVLLRKWERAEKRRISRLNEKDDKLYQQEFEASRNGEKAS